MMKHRKKKTNAIACKLALDQVAGVQTRTRKELGVIGEVKIDLCGMVDKYNIECNCIYFPKNVRGVV